MKETVEFCRKMDSLKHGKGTYVRCVIMPRIVVQYATFFDTETPERPNCFFGSFGNRQRAAAAAVTPIPEKEGEGGGRRKRERAYDGDKWLGRIKRRDRDRRGPKGRAKGVRVYKCTIHLGEGMGR